MATLGHTSLSTTPHSKTFQNDFYTKNSSLFGWVFNILWAISVHNTFKTNLYSLAVQNQVDKSVILVIETDLNKQKKSQIGNKWL